jgi:bifunctional non-homologous end joining protein LigD
MKLSEYGRKRDFRRTPEPRAEPAKSSAARLFVVHAHAASSLHYDLRLEHGGVLLSWAVPKGPSLNPRDKRLAVRVEDHPLAYARFEGAIPAGQYGAGATILWDRGRWKPVGDVDRGLRIGKLDFELTGRKLKGRWVLLGIGGLRSRRGQWLLVKRRDAHARTGAEAQVSLLRPESVGSGLTLAQLGGGRSTAGGTAPQKKRGKAGIVRSSPTKKVVRRSRVVRRRTRKVVSVKRKAPPGRGVPGPVALAGASAVRRRRRSE